MYRLSDFIEKEAKTKQGEISADAGYTQDDVESFSNAWRARQKALKSGKGYDTAKIQTDAINQVDKGTRWDIKKETDASAAKDPNGVGTVSLGTKLKAGGQLLKKNFGNIGGQAKSIENARAWENYQTRVGNTAAQSKKLQAPASVMDNVKANYANFKGEVFGKNALSGHNNAIKSFAGGPLHLPGARDVTKARTGVAGWWDKGKDLFAHNGMGNYSKATRQAGGKQVAGGLNTMKNIGWGLAAGVPLLAGLWGMSRMGKTSPAQTQQQQAPQSPFAANQYRGV